MTTTKTEKSTKTKKPGRTKLTGPGPTARPRPDDTDRPTGVDPRFKARRIQVRRTEGRRRLRTLAFLAGVTLATIAAIGLVNSSWLDVDELTVAGAVQTDEARLVSATGIRPGDPLLDLDIESARTSVERLPWVLDAAIDRRWNGTVVVTVTERVPAAVIALDEGYMLVDATGRQLAPIEARPPEFMPIAGIVASGEVGQPAPPATQAVLRLVSELPPQLEVEVEQVLADEGTLYLDLRSGGRAKLGDDTALAEKIVSLETILAKVDLRCLWEIDVRVPTAPAVTRIDALGNPRATLTDLSDCT